MSVAANRFAPWTHGTTHEMQFEFTVRPVRVTLRGSRQSRYMKFSCKKETRNPFRGGRKLEVVPSPLHPEGSGMVATWDEAARDSAMFLSSTLHIDPETNGWKRKVGPGHSRQ